ncbi:MAG: sulfatase-like hydrolase/transferase, partial [Oscillospiraceae bacterium]
LASDRIPNIGFHCEKTAVPKEKQGGYKDYWRASDVLEFTSHGYDGYVFDGEGNQIDFKGYRADAINQFALDYLDQKTSDKPFFMFVSHIEPHHQNDHHCYEGPKELVPKFKDYPIPPDLSFLKGDYKEMYPDYLAAINSLDSNVGKLVEKLKEKGIYENTIIIYTSDHGSHFKTRNVEYKRSCHDSATHTPLIISGGAFKGGKSDDRIVSLIDLPPTLLDMAGIDIPKSYSGKSLIKQMNDGIQRDCAFIQISESQCGRAIRTKDYKYCVKTLPPIGYVHHSSPIYFEDYLYDLKKDPIEKDNLIKSSEYASVRKELKQKLINQMVNAGESKPTILPAYMVRKK